MARQRIHPLCMFCGDRPVRHLPTSAAKVPGKAGYVYRHTQGYNVDDPSDANGSLDYFCSDACAARWARTTIQHESTGYYVWCSQHDEWERIETEQYERGARCYCDETGEDEGD